VRHGTRLQKKRGGTACLLEFRLVVEDLVGASRFPQEWRGATLGRATGGFWRGQRGLCRDRALSVGDA